MNVEFVCGKLDTGLLGCVTCKDTAAALRCSEGFCGCVPAMQPMLLVTLDLQANLMLLSQTTMAYRGSDLSIHSPQYWCSQPFTSAISVRPVRSRQIAHVMSSADASLAASSAASPSSACDHSALW
jgi:hypothetical protein